MRDLMQKLNLRHVLCHCHWFITIVTYNNCNATHDDALFQSTHTSNPKINQTNTFKQQISYIHLASPRRTAQYQIGHIAILGYGTETNEGVLIAHDIVEIARTVLFDPWHVVPSLGFAGCGLAFGACGSGGGGHGWKERTRCVGWERMM